MLALVFLSLGLVGQIALGYESVDINRQPDAANINNCNSDIPICRHGDCQYVRLQWDSLVRTYSLCTCKNGYSGEYCEKADQSFSIASQLPGFVKKYLQLNVDEVERNPEEDAIVHEFSQSASEVDIMKPFDIEAIPLEEWTLVEDVNTEEREMTENELETEEATEGTSEEE